MNKEDLSNYEKEGLRGLGSYQETVEFALHSIAMEDTYSAIRALRILNKELEDVLKCHGVIHVD